MPGYEFIGTTELEAINDFFKKSNGVLFAHGFDSRRNGIYKVREFEKSITNYLGVKHCQAVSSGTAALLVALKALGIKPGDEVITSSFTFIATAEAIIASGATPVFAEIDNSLNIDPNDVERIITNKTKVIIPVHMAGTAADMDKIINISKKYNIKILEDSAQNIGGSHKGKYLGTLGDIGIYSLDFAKTITTGEGGLIVTNDQQLFERSRAFHDHGHNYDMNLPRGEDACSMIGFNYRMSELQAVIGLVQLNNRLKEIVFHQKENKKQIKNGLSDLNVNFRQIHDEANDIGDTLIIMFDNSKQAFNFAKKIRSLGMGTKNLPDAIKWHFSGHWDHINKSCFEMWPKTRDLLSRSVALPVLANFNKEEIQKIIYNIRLAIEEI